jgi:4-hydroxy-2-oxoheptanedioate aldolase
VAPELAEAIGKVLRATHNAGKKCGIFSVGGEQAKAFAGQGFDMISVATDFTALEFTMKQAVSVAKSEEGPRKGGSY